MCVNAESRICVTGGLALQAPNGGAEPASSDRGVG